MRRLLFLAYHFPPQGGAGTQRAVKFARDLPALGYDPVIITGAESAGGRWTPRDATLAEELARTEIRRIEQAPPASGGRREALARWAGLPSPFAGWWAPNAAVACMQAAAERSVDAILATMSPYESGAVASAAAQSLGIPWIADLRDPWALDEMRVYPSRLHRMRDMTRMRRVLGTADAIVMNTPEAAARLVAAFPELGAKRITSIPNGWDEADFAGAAPETESSAFRIVHTGALHTAMGQRGRSDRLRRLLGGSQDVDVLPRSHVFLLEALRLLRERAPELAADVEVHLAGVTTAADREAARDPAVRLHGYLPHAESVALLRSADLLFLPMHDLPPGRRATIVPGKTYEYLAAKRPVLAAVPDGDARDLLLGSPASVVCRPRDVRRLSEALERLLEQHRTAGRPEDCEWPESSRYERRRLSAELARVLDVSVGAVPAAAEARPRLTLAG